MNRGMTFSGNWYGAVVVGAVRDRDRDAEGLVVGAHRVVAAGLRRVVGRARPVGRVLGEQLVAVEVEVAVDLAGGDVVEAADADPLRRLEQGLGAEDVGAEEAAGVDDREAVVRLGREVHDDVDALLAQQTLGQVEVADVALDERERALDVGEALPVPGVGEQIEDDDVVVRVLHRPVAGEVRADEPGAAGDEDVHGVRSGARRGAATGARSRSGGGWSRRASTASARRAPSRRRWRGRPTRRRARRSGCSSRRRGR